MRVVGEARELRDERVMRMFVAGCSYRTIARAVGLRSHRTIGDIVHRELGLRGGVSRLLTDTGKALFVERSEALLMAHWSAALEGDHDATKICIGVLEDQARFYGLTGPLSATP